MPADEELRDLLVARLPELRPDVESGLERVLSRARSRARRRRAAYIGGLAAAVVATLLVLQHDWSPATDRQLPVDEPDVPALMDRGVYMDPVLLEAGRYRMEFAHAYDGFPEVEVSVPAGWGQDGPDGLATGPGNVDSTRHIALLTQVLQTQQGPCPGRLRAPRPGTLGLATALSTVTGTTAEAPRAVTLDGHAGYFVRLRGPTGWGELRRCAGKFLALYLQPSGTPWFQAPGWTSLYWVLDVGGRTALIDASYGPDVTPAQVQEMVGMVESLRFVGP